MWENQVIQVLSISALIFFNLFCFVGIFAGIIVGASARGIQKKVSELTDKGKETLDQVQDVAYNAGEMGFNILSVLAPFFIFRGRKSKKSGLFSKFFNRE